MPYVQFPHIPSPRELKGVKPKPGWRRKRVIIPAVLVGPFVIGSVGGGDTQSPEALLSVTQAADSKAKEASERAARDLAAAEEAEKQAAEDRAAAEAKAAEEAKAAAEAAALAEQQKAAVEKAAAEKAAAERAAAERAGAEKAAATAAQQQPPRSSRWRQRRSRVATARRSTRTSASRRLPTTTALTSLRRTSPRSRRTRTAWTATTTTASPVRAGSSCTTRSSPPLRRPNTSSGESGRPRFSKMGCGGQAERRGGAGRHSEFSNRSGPAVGARRGGRAACCTCSFQGRHARAWTPRGTAPQPASSAGAGCSCGRSGGNPGCPGRLLGSTAVGGGAGASLGASRGEGPSAAD
jgi:hypothetical protein